MKFTLSWLKDHLDADADLTRIVDVMTMAGMEVEDIFDPAAKLSSFSVAKVIEASQHPNADRLRVCQVDTRDGRKEIVCGAPNARAGMTTIYAPIGAYVPGIDTTLEARPVRGVVSNGMLCSAKELEAGEESDGILDLKGDWPVGAPAAEALGLADPVIDFEVTPNRPDWLGVAGIARELAAAGLGARRTPPVRPVKGAFACPIEIRIDAPDACPVFAGRLIRGLKNGPSPAWLQARLKAVGLRPISALVDVTNYLSLDRARPLHVYDAARLSGPVCARLGRSGETLDGLDARTYAVTPEMCVIADDARVLGLGGVMGGAYSGATADTVDVFLESAWFDPLRTFQTGRATGINSDAKYRFERGVDPGFVVDGLELATRMILDLCGGEASSAVVAGAVPQSPPPVDFDPAEVTRLTGMRLKPQRIRAILRDLGFDVQPREKTLRVGVPSWRRDVEGPADLVEDIARIEGFDALPAQPLPPLPKVRGPIATAAQNRVRLTRRALAGAGFLEAITWAFLPRAHAQAFGGGAPGLVLANPIASDLDTMRPSLLPNLLRATQRNAHRGLGASRLFETGAVFFGGKPGEQWTAAAAVRAGQPSRHWAGAQSPPDVFQAKADLFALLETLGLAPARFQIVRADVPWAHPGRAGAVKLGPKVTLAVFGEFHPRTLQALDIDLPAAGFELILDHLPAEKARLGKTRPPLAAQDLMPVWRDFAFLVDDRIAAADVVRAAAGADKTFISDVRVFDLYCGPGVPSGKKSLALEIRLQPRDKTLTDAEIDAVGKAVVAAVQKAVGASLRS